MAHKEVTFLVVDDDDLDFKILKRAFKNLKINNAIIRATDGIEALDMLKGRVDHPAVERPFIILLDLTMPRMGGLEFLDAIRADEDLKKTVVFVLTSSNMERDIEDAYARHVAGYIHKGNPEADFQAAIGMIDHYWRVVELPVE